ncbi:MAG: hypothetical protein QM730_01330 [Anaerolineales bacterium]
MKNNSLLSFLILVVLVAAAYLIVKTVQQTSEAAKAPFEGLNQQNHALQTQMSNLLKSHADHYSRSDHVHQ